VATGRVAIARASEVDPQCVLIFEADLRNPLTRQKNKENLNLNLNPIRPGYGYLFILIYPYL